MAIFKTKFEVVASGAEVERYYETATKKINSLLKKYGICDAEGTFEEVSPTQLVALLSPIGLFQSTPLKSIFIDQRRQFIPQEIVLAFRSVISDPPVNIKAAFLDKFITLLKKRGWDKPLSTYFEEHYDLPSDSVIMVDDLKDFSLGFGVYRVTFQLRDPHRKEIIVFLKQPYKLSSCNELLYFHLQKKLLSIASDVEAPYRLSNRKREELLLSPLIFGVASDTVLSVLTHTCKKIRNSDHKFYFKKTLAILIEVFIHHAALGDLFGRNDRHLMNSLISFVVEGLPQKTTLEDVINFERFLAHAKNIVTLKTAAISLIDIDLKWLLDLKNADWSLVDIDFGVSELNLLSLLPEFNDYNSATNPFLEKRKEYIAHYFNVYCQKQQAILENKQLLFSTIKKIYPSKVAEKKLEFLVERINFFGKNKAPVVELFKRYLLNFRTRLVYKESLIALDRIAKKSNNPNLLNALKETDLLKYLPARSALVSYKSSVLLQLQCFRGMLSKKDAIKLSKKGNISWEIVASNISMIAKEFNRELFKVLKDREKFIKEDTVVLLKTILS